MAPLVLILIPYGNLNLSCVLAHVDCGGENELDLDTDVCSHVCRGIGIGDVAQTLLNSQNWAHRPLGSLFALFWVLIHLEVYNATHYKIILDFVRSQIIVAGPKCPNYDLTTGLLLRQLSDMVVENNIVAVLILAGHVGPDAKQNVSFISHGMKEIFACLITL